MKKILALVLSATMMLSLFACGAKQAPVETTVAQAETTVQVETTTAQPTNPGKDIKIGVVLIGDETEGYTVSHINGIKEAVSNLGLDLNKNVIFKYNIGETEVAYDACTDLVEQGCKLVITNSYGHQAHTTQAASENTNTVFVAMTGDTAKSSGNKNLHNAFTRIYQGRYVGGVVAGLKLKELIDNKKLTDKNKDEKGNYKIGYVGAYPFAEVISGYTSFFLGIKSIVPNVVMNVSFTNSWSNINAEREAAIALIDQGCAIISQHADTSGAPSACQEKHEAGVEVYCVGYNVDMTTVAPDCALTSPTNNWAVYYTQLFDQVMNGKEIPTDWAEGFETDSVRVTALGKACAEGTQAKIDEVIANIKDGKLHVFDTKTFTVDGKEVTHAFATDTNGDFENDADEAIFDGYYHESHFKSAPSFGLSVDGIKKLN